ncbi:MAG: tetratricopeptide repeat protein [Candidatus Thorarchaeota archaeon]
MDRFEERIARVNQLKDAKRYEEALDILQKLLTESPNDWRLINEIGHLHMAQDDPKAAAAKFQAAIEIVPESAGLWSNLGYALKEMGDLQGAVDATRTSKKFARKTADINGAEYNLACYMALLGKKEQALEYLSRVCRSDESIKLWARDDSDLNSLRSDPRFREIIE